MSPKNILRKFSFLIYLIIVVAGTLVSTTVFQYEPFHIMHPDFLMILAVYLGFRRTIIEGAFLIFLASLIVKSHSSSTESFLLVIYLYSFAITKGLSKLMTQPTKVTLVMVLFVLSLCSKLGLILLWSLSGKASNAYFHLLITALPQALTTSVVAFFVVELFAYVDRRTFKDLHSEDEYDINRDF